MDRNLLYSSNKDELKDKISALIQSGNSGKYQAPLEKWFNWFIRNYDNFYLDLLNYPNFYRAYYCDRDIFSIQIWIEDENEVKSHVKTLYSNIQNELSDEETIYLE